MGLCSSLGQKQQQQQQKTRQAFGSFSGGSRNELQKKVFWAAVQGMQMGRRVSDEAEDSGKS